MKLYRLVEDAENKGLTEKEAEIEILNITANVADVRDGSLFVAVKGLKFDGNDFIAKAVENGAVAVITERNDIDIAEHLPVITVENSRRALAFAASEFWGRPSEKLCIIGITGTNGKTTTAHILAHVLTENGIRCGVIGTVGTMFGGISETLSHTTPDAVVLHGIFAKMVEAGITHVVMEVSSQALDQDRVYGIDFKVGLFTNLSVDHLDYHKDMKSYAQSKLKLFEMSEICIANRDSDFSEPFVTFKNGKNRVLTFSAHGDADYKAENICVAADGNRYELVKSDNFTVLDVRQKLCGFFNVYNSLAAVAAADVLGVEMNKISLSLSSFLSVKGRMETFMTDRGFTVVIDYAHTPDGLGNVLSSIRLYCKGKILTVFGCGGDRDKSKRPLMGKIAEALSDFVVVTSDNPRNEDPEEIIKDILVGIKNSPKVVAVTDRREAIRYALEKAGENDIVLLAGKGHETYQIINGEKYHLDEREEIEKFLKNR